MKKIMMMVATAAAIFTSCSNSEVVDLSSAGRAIGFETYVGKSTTRGVPVTGTEFAEGATMRVWGFYSKDQLAKEFTGQTGLPNLNGATVTNNGTAWTYSPSAYWKDESAHSFFACAPSIADEKGVEFNEGLFTYTVQDNVDDQIDFMVADPLRNAVWKSTNGDPTTQTFKFHHALSQIKYSAKIGTAPTTESTATDIQITGITMQNLGANDVDIASLATTGVINIVAKEGENDIVYSGDRTGTCNGYTITPATPVTPNIATTEVTNPEYVVVPHNTNEALMLMPQTTSGKVKFTVSLTYTDKNSKLATADAFFITDAAQTWEPNKIYSYKFNIDMPKVMSQKAVIFGKPSVVTWSDVTPGTDLEYTAP